MSLQIEKLEKNMAKLTIEVGADEVEKALESAYQKNKNQISAPGFRKGKVPRAMAEKIHGVEIFYEDAANAMMQSAYEKEMENCEEEVVSAPKVNVVQLEKGKNFIFTAEVALKPEVKLGKYKGIKVSKSDSTVTEEEITAFIDKQREENSRVINIEDRPVQDGDITVINFEGFLDGVPFEGGKAENHTLTIGSGAFIPGFEDKLIGAEMNKEVDVEVSFPEDYHATDLAGKPVVFKCMVKEIKVKELPEVDDDFASEVSEFETVAEYKEDIKLRLTGQKELAAKSNKEDAVIGKIVEDATMEVPDAMIETQQRQLLDEFVQRLQMQGMSIQQYAQFTGATPQSMLDEVKPHAERKIKSRLVLEAVAEAEKLAPTDEEFEAEVKRIGEAYQMDNAQVMEMLGDYGKTQVRLDLAVGKAVDFVVEHAKEGK